RVEPGQEQGAEENGGTREADELAQVQPAQVEGSGRVVRPVLVVLADRPAPGAEEDAGDRGEQEVEDLRVRQLDLRAATDDAVGDQDERAVDSAADEAP